jgi:catechol 2,3-dioxygenase-like lactoylglutathione lyase family enzyme
VLDHVAIRASDLESSERFYRLVLGSLEISPSAGAGGARWGDFVIRAADADDPPTRNLHLAFAAPSREFVDEFWRVGRDAGYEDLGAPGKRPQYTPRYYGAFLRDPDGNSAEAVLHDYVRGSGHVDHLWIGVRDLDASAAFYEAVAPHVGLRPGRRWDGGRQFRGALATFSVVADGRAPTEGLHLAFPAPDPATVEDFHRAATSAGCRELRPPGPPPEGRPSDHAACVLDPDGVTVESVFRA